MGFFKLGTMTLGSMFKKPETVLYPFEKKQAPEGLKGQIMLDASTCILCGMCMRSCTTGAIEVDKAARTWAINHFQCIQCNYCVMQCPKKCLRMDPAYCAPSTTKSVEVIEVPEQKKDKPETTA